MFEILLRFCSFKPRNISHLLLGDSGVWRVELGEEKKQKKVVITINRSELVDGRQVGYYKKTVFVGGKVVEETEGPFRKHNNKKRKPPGYSKKWENL